MKHLCKNCSNEYQEHYCNYCGQSAKQNSRLSTKETFQELVKTVSIFDKILLSTFKNLLFYPEKVGMAYIEGQRKKFTKPTQYLVLILTLIALLDWWFESSKIITTALHVNIPFFSPEMEHGFAIWTYRYMVEYQMFSSLVQIVIVPLFLLLFFKKYDYTYAELVAVNYYYFTTSMFFVFLLLMAGQLFHFSVSLTMMSMAFFSYAFWAYFRFYGREQKRYFIFKMLSIILVINLIRLVLTFLVCWKYPIPMDVLK